MHIQRALEQLGYPHNEIIAYLSLLKMGEATVSELARKTQLPRSTTQLVMNELQKKGLVYGEDKDLVDNTEQEYDRYADIEESSDDLQKALMATDFDSEDTFERRVNDLDEDTRHYYRICVGFEDTDDHLVIKCGSNTSFSTDS